LHSPSTRPPARYQAAKRFHRIALSHPTIYFNHQRLILLYNQKHLQNLHQMANQCRRHFKSIAPNDNSTQAILRPLVIYRNIHFDPGTAKIKYEDEFQLDEIAITLLDMDAKNILIRGHTDSQPF
jgi:flagellar motor protein MotB